MGRVFQKPANFIVYTTEYGAVWVGVVSHRVVMVDLNDVLQAMHDREVYATKGRLIDVETGRVAVTYSRYRKIYMPGNYS